LNVGESKTEYVTCGANGCECTSACNGCVGSITAEIVEEKGKAVTVKFTGLGLGDISFKAGTQGFVTTATNGQYAYSGSYDISHIDVCFKQPTECSCASLTASNPCKQYQCVSGACVEVPLPDGTACGAAESECLTAETCSNGQCKSDFKPIGTECGDQTENACNEPDTCNGAGVCEKHEVADGTVCGNEETECMYADKCSVGQCVLGLPKPKGESCGDSSAGPCNHPDTCDGQGSCQANLVPDMTECKPGKGVCDPADVCQSGVCVEAFAAEGDACGSNPAGECDLQDTCDGKGACIDRVMDVSTVCRPAATECDVPETCDGSHACPADSFVTAGTGCGSAVDTECDDPDTCDGMGNCLTNLASSGSACGDSSSGPCDKPDTCDGSGSCLKNLEDDGTVCKPKADACDVDDTCLNGVCIEEFADKGASCGNAPLGDCDVQDTCDGAGACVDNMEPTSKVCREGASDCDVEEKCDGVNVNCPEDAFQAMDTPCGSQASSDCDKPNTCDGFGKCLDNFASSGTHCDGLPVGDCDLQDQCDGMGTCVESIATSGTVCREAAGECDVAESCDGSSKECPTDAFVPANTDCGNAPLGVCDLQDKCDGAGACVDHKEPTSTVCRATTSDCDVEEKCSGVDVDCPADAFKPMDSPCGSQASSDCDKPNTCDGTGKCLDNFAISGTHCDGLPMCGCNLQDQCDGMGACVEYIATAGTVCRAAAGECDVPESCDGANKACPADAFSPATTKCGPSMLQKCELQDYCSGSGSCADSGIALPEYSFKCGTVNYLCGDNIKGTECTEKAQTTMTATKAQCDGLIANLMLHKQGKVDIYTVTCPNGNSVSHYVSYDCDGLAGVKCEGGSLAAEQCSPCYRRFLRNAFM